MRVMLINPPVRSRTRRVPAIVGALFYNSPPLGLATVAAVLEEAGHEVGIVDAPVEELTVAQVASRLARLRPDVVGITATTSFFHHACEVARAVRDRLPRATVCLGGPHLASQPHALLDHPEFHFGVMGEGEITAREALACLERGRPVDDVPGVVVARAGRLHFASPRAPVEDLDRLPLPARHLLPMDRYRPVPNDRRALPKASMIVSRGCPFSCIFCSKDVFGRHFRASSPRRVREEMRLLEEVYRVRDIAFVDSTFTPSRARLEAVLDAFEADPPRASWTASCRADVLDEGLLRRMRDLGCWRVRVAIESGNAEILATIRKGITRERFAETVHLAHGLGIRVKGFFMVGHVGETARTVEETIRFALELPLSDITVQINTPIPGTPQYEMCARHGTLLAADSHRFTFFEPIFVPRGMTARQLVAAQRSFYRRFYLRPGHLWRTVRGAPGLPALGSMARALPLAASLMVPPLAPHRFRVFERTGPPAVHRDRAGTGRSP